MGRITKYTKERADTILEALSAGVSITGACGMVSISRSTFYAWRKDKVGFDEAVSVAQGQAERKAIDKVMSTPATALKWLLMKRKEDYKQPIDVVEVHDIKGIVMVSESEAEPSTTIKKGLPIREEVDRLQ